MDCPTSLALFINGPTVNAVRTVHTRSVYYLYSHCRTDEQSRPAPGQRAAMAVYQYSVHSSRAVELINLLQLPQVFCSFDPHTPSVSSFTPFSTRLTAKVGEDTYLAVMFVLPYSRSSFLSQAACRGNLPNQEAILIWKVLALLVLLDSFVPASPSTQTS
jgi:hypothetical protein